MYRAPWWLKVERPETGPDGQACPSYGVGGGGTGSLSLRERAGVRVVSAGPFGYAQAEPSPALCACPERSRRATSPRGRVEGRLRSAAVCRLRRAGMPVLRGSRPTATGGLTLMECIVAIGIFMVLTTLALQLYIVTHRAIVRQELAASREGSERDLLAMLRRDARLARAVAPESSATRLVLLMPDGERIEYRAAADHVTRRSPSLPETTHSVSGPVTFAWWPEGRAQCVTVRLASQETGKAAGATGGRAGRALTVHLRNAHGGW